MSQNEQVKKDHATYLVPNYAPNLVFTRGKGARLWDAEGNEYLDFLAGIAVMSLGHSHPVWVKAVQSQAETLAHVSNLHYHPGQPALAKKLVEKFQPGSKAFFCNSGAEANEALIKMARKWGHDKGRYEIISFTNSFHGRTLATLTATGQSKVQDGFEPLPDGFAYAEFNNVESVKDKITPQTVAVLVEPIQAEGGVIPATSDFFQKLRALCDEHDLLLLVDDVQCGIGRTGEWFGFESYGIIPDAFSLAKGLGGGFPVGAVLARAPLCDVLQPGSHGTTFGGNAMACAAALAVLDTIEGDKLLENVRTVGSLLADGLRKLADAYSWISEIRGMGLIWGMVIDRPAKPLETFLLEEGLITVATSNTVIRLVPPLTITVDDVAEALEKLQRACDKFNTTIS